MSDRQCEFVEQTKLIHYVQPRTATIIQLTHEGRKRLNKCSGVSSGHTVWHNAGQRTPDAIVRLCARRTIAEKCNMVLDKALCFVADNSDRISHSQQLP
jgi:hypothetical protein